MVSVDRPRIEGTPVFHNSPIHLLTRLSTTPVSSYTYLKHRQQTAHAVTPVHSPDEFRKYTAMMETGGFALMMDKAPPAGQPGKAVNWEKFSIRWNQDVNDLPEGSTKQIFYKLPEHLEKHHKIWAAYRAEKATDASRVTHLLPPLSLPETRASLVSGSTSQTETETDIAITNRQPPAPTVTSFPTANSQAPAVDSNLLNAVSNLNNVLHAYLPPGSNTVSGQSSGAGPSHQQGSRIPVGQTREKKRKAPRRCDHCRADSNCNLEETCHGSGREIHCQCIKNGVHGRNPKNRKRVH
ncbi:hypothetical protein C8J56DRAFT_965053, partial [Mycena floridula]